MALGVPTSSYSPAMESALEHGNEQGAKVWEGLSNMGTALSKLALEHEAAASDRDYKQQKLALERETALADKENKDRQYLLDYQKTLNDTDVKKFQAARQATMDQMAMDKFGMQKEKYFDQKTKDAYLAQPDVQARLAEAYTSGDPNKAKQDWAYLSSKDRLSLFKNSAVMARSNKDKAQIDQFYNRYGDTLLGIETRLKIDPLTGKNNGQELLKELNDKFQKDLNNGVFTSPGEAFKQKQRWISSFSQQINMNTKGATGGSTTQPTQYMAGELDPTTGQLINQRSFLTNTPEGLQQAIQTEARIVGTPGSKEMLIKTTPNKAGIGNISVIKSPQKKKEEENPFAELQKKKEAKKKKQQQ